MSNRLQCLAAAAALAVLSGSGAVAAEKKPYFDLHSPAFKEFAMLSKKYVGNNPPNCDGGNISPALAWSNAPAGTKSFAIEVFDLAGNPPLGLVHWIAYGIPGSKTALKEGDGSESSTALVNGKNGIGKVAYFGPCPPPGRPHPFIFLIMATDLAPDALTPGLTRDDLATALKGHILDRTTFVLRYGH